VSGNQNQIKGMRGRHRGLEHEIHVAKHLESLGGIAAPSHISVGASKISGGGGEVDLLATLHGGQQYLVEAKARGVDAPPQQTRKNVELLMEHRGEYGLVWAINESASEVKAFIKYVSKRHTALADVSRQGRFRRKHTENEYGLILFEKVYGAEPNRNEQWYVKRYRHVACSPTSSNVLMAVLNGHQRLERPTRHARGRIGVLAAVNLRPRCVAARHDRQLG
jgi:hypothetical protein